VRGERRLRAPTWRWCCREDRVCGRGEVQCLRARGTHLEVVPQEQSQRSFPQCFSCVRRSATTLKRLEPHLEQVSILGQCERR